MPLMTSSGQSQAAARRQAAAAASAANHPNLHLGPVDWQPETPRPVTPMRSSREVVLPTGGSGTQQPSLRPVRGSLRARLGRTQQSPLPSPSARTPTPLGDAAIVKNGARLSVKEMTLAALSPKQVAALPPEETSPSVRSAVTSAVASGGAIDATTGGRRSVNGRGSACSNNAAVVELRSDAGSALRPHGVLQQSGDATTSHGDGPSVVGGGIDVATVDHTQVNGAVCGSLATHSAVNHAPSTRIALETPSPPPSPLLQRFTEVAVNASMNSDGGGSHSVKSSRDGTGSGSPASPASGGLRNAMGLQGAAARRRAATREEAEASAHRESGPLLSPRRSAGHGAVLPRPRFRDLLHQASMTESLRLPLALPPLGPSTLGHFGGFQGQSDVIFGGTNVCSPGGASFHCGTNSSTSIPPCSPMNMGLPSGNLNRLVSQSITDCNSFVSGSPTSRDFRCGIHGTSTLQGTGNDSLVGVGSASVPRSPNIGRRSVGAFVLAQSDVSASESVGDGPGALSGKKGHLFDGAMLDPRALTMFVCSRFGNLEAAFARLSLVVDVMNCSRDANQLSEGSRDCIDKVPSPTRSVRGRPLGGCLRPIPPAVPTLRRSARAPRQFSAIQLAGDPHPPKFVPPMPTRYASAEGGSHSVSSEQSSSSSPRKSDGTLDGDAMSATDAPAAIERADALSPGASSLSRRAPAPSSPGRTRLASCSPVRQSPRRTPPQRKMQPMLLSELADALACAFSILPEQAMQLCRVAAASGKQPVSFQECADAMMLSRSLFHIRHIRWRLLERYGSFRAALQVITRYASAPHTQAAATSVSGGHVVAAPRWLSRESFVVLLGDVVAAPELEAGALYDACLHESAAGSLLMMKDFQNLLRNAAPWCTVNDFFSRLWSLASGRDAAALATTLRLAIGWASDRCGATWALEAPETAAPSIAKATSASTPPATIPSEANGAPSTSEEIVAEGLHLRSTTGAPHEIATLLHSKEVTRQAFNALCTAVDVSEENEGQIWNVVFGHNRADVSFNEFAAQAERFLPLNNEGDEPNVAQSVFVAGESFAAQRSGNAKYPRRNEAMRESCCGGFAKSSDNVDTVPNSWRTGSPRRPRKSLLACANGTADSSGGSSDSSDSETCANSPAVDAIGKVPRGQLPVPPSSSAVSRAPSSSSQAPTELSTTTELSEAVTGSATGAGDQIANHEVSKAACCSPEDAESSMQPSFGVVGRSVDTVVNDAKTMASSGASSSLGNPKHLKKTRRFGGG
eukprot:TRINITY_DN13762_c0_g2_i1.p1 TRINITY_DN13762_c0_g2~~TRINITY_DN13762_c0_g2_i1.p1  ORF type:complete len:1254 (+),score=195.79 TRINITY_DN13762_c0_g2_i1:133-3894(+)